MSDAKDGSGPLETYRAKRDFSLTSEPAGAAAEDGTGSRRFVVQRHRARRIHYDFRLEVDGVLASWAMPKGPTLDPSVRALAVHVEDHPIEYRAFEGIIPAGQYGGGDVIVWDRGTWVPAQSDDPAQSIAKGELHFDLYGQKLHGRFALVRTRRQGRQEQWLMIHKHDADAVDGWSLTTTRSPSSRAGPMRRSRPRPTRFGAATATPQRPRSRSPVASRSNRQNRRQPSLRFQQIEPPPGPRRPRRPRAAKGPTLIEATPPSGHGIARTRRSWRLSTPSRTRVHGPCRAASCA